MNQQLPAVKKAGAGNATHRPSSSKISFMKRIEHTPGMLIILLLMMNLFFVNNSFGQTQTYNTPGTYTFVVPAGVTSITVSAWGGGGAGGGISANNPRAGGGGEGGSFVRGTLSPVTPGATYTVVVGAGGTGGTGTGTAGTASSFGGAGVFNAIGGAGGVVGTTGSNFGAGGNTTNTGNVVSGTSTSNFYGGNGGNASSASTATSGGGGGSAGSAGNGGNGGTPTAGTAGSGGGVAGAAGRGSMSDGNGNAGGNPGAGGGGARNANNNTQYSGGNGGNGQVQITWTCASPSLSNLNITFSSTPACANAQATVQLSSSSVPSGGGPYNVYYNLSGANTATAKLATVTFNGANPRIATFNVAAADLINAGSTTVTITSVGCAAPASGQDNSQSLTTSAPLSAVNITPTGSQTICASGTGSALTAAETGGGTVTRQWGKRSVSGGAITNISGQTGSSYTPTGASLTAGTWFVVCTSTPAAGCGSATVSNEVTVTVTPNISAVNITPATPQTFCQDASGSQLTAAETGGTTFTRQWGRRSVSGGAITAISGQTGSAYTPTGASLGAGSWFVVCTSTPAAGCGSATISNEVAIVVNATPQVSLFTGNNICAGGIGQLTVTTNAGTGPFDVTYTAGPVTEPGVVSGAPFNATPNPGSTTNYTITSITDANGCTRNSGFADAAATVTVFTPLTSLSYSTNPAVYCPGVTIAANNPTVVGGTVTTYAVSPALPSGLSLNTSTGVITGTPTAEVAAADYTVTATNICGSVQATVNIKTDVSALATTPGVRCGTGTVSLSAASTSSCIISPTITWFAAPTGGASLGTGTNFTTPSISSTTTYHAQENIITGETTIPNSSQSNTLSRGLQFDLYEPVLLNSVDVDNTSGGGSITVGLRNNTGGAVSGVSDVAFTINGSGTNNGVTTIPLGWNIPAGTGYRIFYSVGTQNLQRNSSGYTYPKGLGVGVITSGIDGNATSASPTLNSGRYNYFYNWRIGRARVPAVATVNTQPTIALGSNPSIARGTATADISYSGTTGSPDEYSIDFNPAAEGAGFIDVTNLALPATPIVLAVPAAADAATYSGTLTVRNTTTGCVSSNNPVSVIVNKTALTVTADDQNKTFDGNTFTGFTSAIAGFINGENSGVVSGSVTYTGAATTATAIGTYTITPVVTGLSATNYTFTPVNGTLSIDPISQANADFRSVSNGNFASAATWEYDLGGGNWQPASQAPTSANSVTITHDVTLDQNYTVGASRSFTLGTGAIFTINPTRTFTVAGSADFGGKPVTIQSDNTGTGSIGQVAGTLANATDVTVERYIPNNGFRSWRLLSVPTFGNGQTIRQAWQEGNANPLPMQNNLANRGTQITGVFTTQAAAAAAGFDSTSVQAGMLSWGGTNWVNVTNTNTAIANNKAYFLYIRGERSKGVTGVATNSSATTLRTNGTIYTGDQVNNIAANTFALVPNVYPSSIDFTGLTRAGGVNNLFYVWDSKKQNGSSLGIYQTFSGTNGFNCLVSGGSYVLGQPNTAIESGQAFFVQTNNNPGSITLKETAKISGTSGNLGLRPSTPANQLVKIDTRLYGPGTNNMIDANAVVFDAAYSNDVDGDDAPKFTNPGENIGIQKAATVLAIEGRQPAGNNDVVQYKIWNLQQQTTYRLEVVASNMATQGVSAVLEDSYLNSITPLDLNGTTAVNFAINSNAASFAANRFRVVFRQLAPVPVNFVSVEANRTNAGVKVNWKSASERGIRNYIVERSADGGRSFVETGAKPAASNNAIEIGYDFMDASAPSAALLYRIKSQGVNNEIRYSPIAKVSAGNLLAGFSVSPNPVENGIMNLVFKNQEAGKYSVKITGSNGQTLKLAIVNHAGGNSNQPVPLPSAIARGSYNVEIVSPDNTKTVQAIMVNTK